MKAAIIVVIVAAIAVGIFAFGGWRQSTREITIHAGLVQRANAVIAASDVLAQGDRPAVWPNRAFIPASNLENLVSLLVGATYQTSLNGKDLKAEKDTALLTVKEVHIKSQDTGLGIAIVVDAQYARGATLTGPSLRIEMEATAVPSSRFQQKDEKFTRLKIVPYQARVTLNAKPFSFSSDQFLNELINAKVLENYSDQLFIDLPEISAPLDFDTSFSSTSDSKFQVTGGFKLTTAMEGEKFGASLNLDRILIARSGLWLLGGLPEQLQNHPPAPDTDQALQEWLKQHEPPLLTALKPFEASYQKLYVRFANTPFLQLAAAIENPGSILSLDGLVEKNEPTKLTVVAPAKPFVSARFNIFGFSFVIPVPIVGGVPVPVQPRPAPKPSMYVINVSSSEAYGVLSNLALMHDVNLGDWDFTVTPDSPTFAHGVVALTPPHLTWTPDIGLTTTVKAHVEAFAQLHLHLSTGKVGGGVGASVGLHGATDANIPLQIRLQRKQTDVGTAVFVAPNIGCAPIAVDVHSAGSGRLIDTTVFRLNDIGMRLRQIIGGGKSAAALLVDNIPRTLDPMANAKMTKNVHYALKHKWIKYTIEPNDPVIDADGLSLQANLHVEGTDDPPDAGYDEKRQALRDAVSDSASCTGDHEIDVLLGNYEIGPNNEFVKAASLIVGTEIHVTEQTFSEAKKFLQNPTQSLSDAPGNAKTEANKGLEHLFGNNGPRF